MVVGSVLNGDCYLTTQYLNQLILSIPSTGVTESGVQGMQVHHKIEKKYSPSKQLLFSNTLSFVHTSCELAYCG